MTKNQDHTLFQRYPIRGETTLSTGAAPIPYHVYDGHGMLIGGTADLAAVSALLAGQPYLPVRTGHGRALVGLWVCDFTEASLGPHNELQVSIFVTRAADMSESGELIASRPLSLLGTLVKNPAVRLLCHGIWNDGETAVAYNREHLSLPARPNQGKITRAYGMKLFEFRDEDGRLIVHGQVREETATPLPTGLALLREIGLRRAIRLARTPELAAKVVNPVTERVPRSVEATAIIASDTPVVQIADPTRDWVEFSRPDYQAFDFRPRFVEHFEPFRFVYLDPS